MADKKNVCSNSNVTIKMSGREVTLHIIGDFDGSTTHIVHQCCKKIQDKGKIDKVILDFSKAGRVDTSAFACIINFIKEHVGSGTGIFVTNLRSTEEKLLQMLRVEKLIKVI
ncbi:MAG: STAS domain-containing protein [Candidatus Omnitrophica bacterium]|nr:STAS domain-containing protein [Candidatus Omnitrophota bacterium]